MTKATIEFAPGQSRATEPVDWPHGLAVVSVACNRTPWPAGSQLTLEGREIWADGRAHNWKPLAQFQADDERRVAIPPGRIRWQVSQASDESLPWRWVVDVTEPRKRRAAEHV